MLKLPIFARVQFQIKPFSQLVLAERMLRAQNFRYFLDILSE